MSCTTTFVRMVRTETPTTSLFLQTESRRSVRLYIHAPTHSKHSRASNALAPVRDIA